MSESVRVVIWDLDETFWRGTLTEGGVQLRQDTPEIVRALADRGIISTICSKNDFAEVEALLRAEGLWELFVLPSIDWSPKGPRITALIDDLQLRAASALFLDDNPANLQEARHFAPDLQVASHEAIETLLDDPRLQGKPDPERGRLRQYKQLERRKADQARTQGDATDFLRASDIRVTLEHDVGAHLDRAVELINRTNQLNFTKARLSEAPEAARAELQALLASHEVQAALVRVRDAYGDHGWCGLYVLWKGRLLQFAFSCRILGMGVETWLYRRLGRPVLDVQGAVLSDPAAPGPEIDWITVGERGDSPAVRGAGGIDGVKRLVARGGCDLAPLEHYFSLSVPALVSEFNGIRLGTDGRIDHSTFLRQALRGPTPEAVEAGVALGYWPQDLHTALWDGQTERDVWILSFVMDAVLGLYQHRTLDLQLPLAVDGFLHDDVSAVGLDALPPRLRTPELEAALETLRRDYDYAGPIEGDALVDTLRQVFARAAPTTRVFVIGANEYFEEGERGFVLNPHRRVNAWIAQAAADFPNVAVLNIRDYVRAEHEVHEQAHFHRMVYHRLFEDVSRRLRDDDLSPARPNWAFHAAADPEQALAGCDDPHVLGRTAAFLREAGRLEEAAPLARRAAALAPESPMFRAALLEALLATGEGEEALRVSEAGAEPHVLHRLAMHVLLPQGRLEGAERALRRAEAQEPQAWLHRHALATVLRQAGRPEEALEVLRACVRDGDPDPDVAGQAQALAAELDAAAAPAPRPRRGRFAG